MKVSAALVTSALAALCAAQDIPTDRDGLLKTDYSKFNESQCLAYIQAYSKLLPPDPYDGKIWQEGKDGTREQWYNAGIADQSFSNDTSRKTLYCGKAGKRANLLDNFKQAQSSVYCNGQEGQAGIQVQPTVAFDRDTNRCVSLSNNYRDTRGLCGCKNQPPTPPQNANIVSGG